MHFQCEETWEGDTAHSARPTIVTTAGFPISINLVILHHRSTAWIKKPSTCVSARLLPGLSFDRSDRSFLADFRAFSSNRHQLR